MLLGQENPSDEDVKEVYAPFNMSLKLPKLRVYIFMCQAKVHVPLFGNHSGQVVHAHLYDTYSSII